MIKYPVESSHMHGCSPMKNNLICTGTIQEGLLQNWMALNIVNL